MYLPWHHICHQGWSVDILYNGTARFKKCKHLFEYQHLLFLRDVWSQCYKTFYVRNLRIFIVSQSVRPSQILPVKSDV